MDVVNHLIARHKFVTAYINILLILWQNTLPIPDLFYFQLSLLVYKYVHRKQTLPTSYTNYFTMNNMIHSYCWQLT